MRTSFRRELKKLDDSQKSGAGADDLYDPSLWYFDALLFLRDQETPAQSQSTIQEVLPQEQIHEIDDDDQETDDSHDQSTSIKSTPKPPNPPGPVPMKSLKRRKVEKPEDDLISLACKRLKEPDNEFTNVAKTWADELSKMDAQQQLFAKKAINDVLFEGRCGNLHRNAVQINVIPHDSRANTPISSMSEPATSSYGSGYHFHMGHRAGYVSQQQPTIAGNYIPEGQNDLANFFTNFNPNTS